MFEEAKRGLNALREMKGADESHPVVSPPILARCTCPACVTASPILMVDHLN